MAKGENATWERLRERDDAMTAAESAGKPGRKRGRPRNGLPELLATMRAATIRECMAACQGIADAEHDSDHGREAGALQCVGALQALLAAEREPRGEG